MDLIDIYRAFLSQLIYVMLSAKPFTIIASLKTFSWSTYHMPILFWMLGGRYPIFLVIREIHIKTIMRILFTVKQ